MKKILIQKYISNIFKCLLPIGILICVLINPVYPQEKNVKFKHLSINDGLSQNVVYCIMQDKYGMIWIGTDDGLNRYNGYSFQIFKNVPRNSESISNGSIRAIFEDSRGKMWIGTRRGMNLFDRKSNKFTRLPKWSDFIVVSIAEDKKNNIWIGTNVGLYKYDLISDSVTVFSPDNTSRNIVSRMINGPLNEVFVDSRNYLWICSTDGLHLYDSDNNSFINYYHDENISKSIASNDVRTILEDKAGRIWVATSDGLDLFENAHEHPLDGKFIHHKNDINDTRSISKGTVLSLLEDDKNNLWIGVENGGVNVLNLNTYTNNNSEFVHYESDLKRKTALNNNSIYSIYQDRQGIIWIGTCGGGLNILNPGSDNFIHIKGELGSDNSLSNNQVNVMLEEDKFIWIGTEGGLNRYDKTNGTFKHYVHDNFNRNSIGSNAVWALCKDKRGNLWVGTWAGGLNRYDYKTEKFERYYKNPQDTTSIGSNNIFSICEDSKGNLWIGTMGGGLNKFISRNKTFKRYNVNNSPINTNYVPSIIETKNGDLWLANETSFIYFSPDREEFKTYLHSETDSTSLSSNKAIAIYEDSKENIWMGTDAGLNLFNKSTKKFKCYQIEDGLPDNSINSILEDNNGNLWLATNKGLSKFINAVNLPDKPEFTNYVDADGMQGNQFGPRSCLNGSDGMLYFGGANGYNVFNPDRLSDNTFIPPVVITGFYIFNQPESIGDLGFNMESGSSENLVLSYRQSVISFDFAALNYISPLRNQYAYKMEGFDKEWNYVGTKHSATYTNLDPGEYVFRVKGSNNDGVWNEKGISVPIVITPPFWKTWLFRILVIAIGIISIVMFYKYRTYAIRKRNKELEKNIEERTRELADKKNLLQTVIDMVPDPIYVKDKEHKYILNNRVHIESLGLKTQEDLIGKSDADFFKPDQVNEAREDERTIMETGTPVINKEEKGADPLSGMESWVLTSKVQFKNDRKELLGIVGISRLITERKRAEEERERLISELQEALADIKMLSGLVPICANCKKIRDDQGYWTQIESYIQDRSNAKFSHSICPDCAKKIYPQYNLDNISKKE
ncbi:MAG: PAS domain-containing protein [Bacteroidetes bacterium]|nr:PAS domain-containing protein [Bacteroidota bacterium]